MGVHAGIDDPGDVVESEAIVQEGVDRDLIGGVEHAWHRPTHLAGDLGELEASKGVHIRGPEGKGPELSKINAWRGGIPALGIREGVLDGNAHV